MYPVLKRILLRGGATAVILAGSEVLLAEMALAWVGAEQFGAADLNAPLRATLRYRVPLMVALWGFLFVAIHEFVMHLVRRSAKPPVDDAEKLLDELLTQAEAKMALDALRQRADAVEQEADKKESDGQVHTPS